MTEEQKALLEKATKIILGDENSPLYDSSFWEDGTDLMQTQEELWLTRAEYETRTQIVINLALERAAKVADAYAEAALKCEYCGDVRNTYTTGGCSGETKWRATERYRTMVALDGAYEATRYFEKHLCDPRKMDQKEAFEAFAAAIRALIKET